MGDIKIPKKLGRPPKSLGAPIPTTVVFHWNKMSDQQVVINRGGARSSKSYSIAQLLIEWFFSIPDIRILVLRKTQPSLRLSCVPLIYSIIGTYGLRGRIGESKQDKNIMSPCGGLIHFGGLDDPEKIRSSEWNVIWCEEATEFEYDDFINLKLRLSAPAPSDFRNRIFLSFNPVDENHWIRTKIIANNSEDFGEIQSTYKYNPFLSDDYIKTIESLELQDRNYYRIFTLGEWGRLDHVIYSNWDSIKFLPDGGFAYGLDFGYNVPTALVKLSIDGRDVSIDEKLYRTQLTNSALIAQLSSIIPESERGNAPIYADVAEPDRIREIREAGFWCVEADKSVKPGIDYVKSCRLHITDGSDNILKEVKGYSYRTDRNGNVLDEPVKFSDHTMDAIRYAVWTYHKEGRDGLTGTFFKVM
jgi:phage terminase large subunit